MVDDMADTAGTLCKAAAALKENGATAVYAYATHPVLSGDAVDNIKNSEIDRLVVTDTIPLKYPAAELVDEGKLQVISVSQLLAATIQRISKNLSISEMYSKSGLI